MGRLALILGAASQIGAALMKGKRLTRYEHVVFCDKASSLHHVRALLNLTDYPLSRATVSGVDPARPFAGLSLAKPPFTEVDGMDLFHLLHSRDRSKSGSDVREHNRLMLERVFGIAHKFGKSVTSIIVTDIGLVGDYPGRFSENWVDAGQMPFDEVDRSSLEVELACLKERHHPIIRARVGLVLDPQGISSALGYWEHSSGILIGFSKLLKSLPRLISLPVAVAKGALAPVTPADLAADVLLAAIEKKAIEGAIHIIADPPPTIEMVLEVSQQRVGGARLKPGLPVDKVTLLGRIPGFKELARRNADQLAAWWTPHRYCLSRNEVDTTILRQVLPSEYEMPTWPALKALLR